MRYLVVHPRRSFLLCRIIVLILSIFFIYTPFKSAFSTDLGISSGLIKSSSYSGYEISFTGSYPMFSYKALSISPALLGGLNQMASESESDVERNYKQIDERFISLGIDTGVRLGSNFTFQTGIFVGKLFSNQSDRKTSSDLNIEASLQDISGIRYDIKPSVNYQISDTNVYLSLVFNYSIHEYNINKDPEISGERLTNEGKFSITSSQKNSFKLIEKNTPSFKSRRESFGTSFGITIKI